LGKICVDSFLVDTYNTFRFLVKGDEFVSETPSDTALRLVPLRVEWYAGLLGNDWSSKLSIWVRLKAFWLE